MVFSQEELSNIVEEIRDEAEYFSRSDSILNRCCFHQVEDKNFDDVAVDKVTERELRFSIIGRVVRKTTFLQPEGAFRLSGASPPKEEDLEKFLSSRMKVSLAPPRGIFDARAAQDEWLSYQSTLNQLIKSSTSTVEDDNLLVWSPFRKDRNVFMLRHVLISERETTLERKRDGNGPPSQDRCDVNPSSSQSGELDDDPIDDAEGNGLPDQQRNVERHIEDLTRIKNWPGSENWHKIADRFDNTHFINPLAAFDDEYELIAPQVYEFKLLGAVVHARFTLSRFEIRGTHVFVCNIVELQVLKPPSGGADIRKKRTLADLVMRKKRKKRRTI